MEEKLSKIWGNMEANKKNETRQENIQTPPTTEIGIGTYLT
jgi:hypothetical protein